MDLLAVLHLTAWKFPLELVPSALSPPTNEHPPVANNDANYHLLHN